MLCILIACILGSYRFLSVVVGFILFFLYYTGYEAPLHGTLS